MSESKQTRRVLEQFVQESRVNLKTIETSIATSRSGTGDEEQLRILLRAFHSIKGISGFASAVEIGQLSHEAESLLMEVKAGRCSLDDATLDLLLTVHDQLVDLLEAIESGSAAPDDWRAVLLRMSELTGSPARESASDPDRDVDGFADVVAQQLVGLDMFLAKLVPGPVDPRLTKAVQRKLNLIRRSARSSSHTGVVDYVEQLSIWFGANTSWHPEQIEELQARVKHLARLSVTESPPLPGAESTAKTDERAPTDVTGDQDPRVPIRSYRLHQLSTQIEELVVSHNRLEHILDELTHEQPGTEVKLRGIRTEIDRVVALLEKTTQRIQMVELAVLFDRIPRMVRQIAREGGKQVALSIHGADTEVDRAIVDLLGDPLTHIVKNAIDHGIESRAQRTGQGKSGVGALNIHAYALGKHIFIDIHDDGRGIDPKLIRNKAVEKGYLTSIAAQRMSDTELIDVIYAPGFTSSDRVTHVSGRGVGMDAVLQRINEMGGQIKIKSEVGVGTTIRIILPNSFALMSCLVVRCGEHLFAVPIRFVKETLRIDERRIVSRGAARWLRHKGSLVRIRPLELAIEGFEHSAAGQRRHALVMAAIGSEVVFDVDEIVAVSTLSVRSLPAYLESRRALAGITTVGGDKIAFFLHALAIVEAFTGPESEVEQKGERGDEGTRR